MKGGLISMDDIKKEDVVAIFRYGLIAPALHMSGKERKKYFLELAGKEFDVPHYGRKKYRADTFRNWLRQYKNGGLDNLKPEIRCDKGIVRKISEKASEALKNAIDELPFLSCAGIYRLLLKRGNISAGDFSETTLRNYVKNNNLRSPVEKGGRKKYEKENVNELWVTDFMNGPCLKDGKRKRQAYLCAIIDDHSRMITGNGFYFYENSPALAYTLKRAISVYGIPNVLYCDNGSVFVSAYLQLVCARLGIALVHSKPYDSPSRGKIERFFRTVREKFLAGLDYAGIKDLAQLNTLFDHWLDNDYHKQHHSGINQRPSDRYFNNCSKITIKTIPEHEIDNCFLNIISRYVRNDATLSINKRIYEVPPGFIGKKVELSFPIDKPDLITLMDKGKPFSLIKPVNPAENANKPHTSIHFKDIRESNNIIDNSGMIDQPGNGSTLAHHAEQSPSSRTSDTLKDFGGSSND